jgi:hypothetical protein
MKKLLSIAAVATLLSTGANAVNTIGVAGTVLPSAVVSFSDASAQALGTNKFIDGLINIGTNNIGAFTAIDKPLFVRTNVAPGNTVTMSITDTTNSGSLAGPVGSTAIPMAYAFGATGAEAPIVLGTPFTVATGANAGSITVGNFKATPTVAANQLAGSYSTALTVAIVAN